jgi:hypothetical protein
MSNEQPFQQKKPVDEKAPEVSDLKFARTQVRALEAIMQDETDPVKLQKLESDYSGALTKLLAETKVAEEVEEVKGKMARLLTKKKVEAPVVMKEGGWNTAGATGGNERRDIGAAGQERYGRH